MSTGDFGIYIYEKRKSKKITLREMANKLNISPTYLADVEKNRRKAFPPEKLLLLANVLEIDNETELYHYFDIAGASRNSIAFDVESFMLQNPEIIDFVRKVKYNKMISTQYINDMLSTIKERQMSQENR